MSEAALAIGAAMLVAAFIGALVGMMVERYRARQAQLQRLTRRADPLAQFRQMEGTPWD